MYIYSFGHWLFSIVPRVFIRVCVWAVVQFNLLANGKYLNKKSLRIPTSCSQEDDTLIGTLGKILFKTYLDIQNSKNLS